MIHTRMKAVVAVTASFCLACAAFLSLGSTSAAAAPRLTIAMVTHGQPGDSFWDIIRKGANAAAKKDNVKLIYLASPTAVGQAKMVDNVIQQHVDGIAMTLAFPDAMKAEVDKAKQAGIPIVGFNAGYADWKKMGLMSYVGQDEGMAGEAVGRRLNALGAKSAVCLDQQQGAVQLEERCDGIGRTFKGKLDVLYTPGYDMAAAQSRLVAKLQQNTNIDYIITLGAPFVPPALTAVQMAGSKAKVATFDLTPRAVGLIKEGKCKFAVDQQPFVQGYEAVDLLWLYKTNGNIVGGGDAVWTGPSFDDQSNIDMIAKFAKRGTR